MVIHILLNIPQGTCCNNTHNPERNTAVIHKRIRLRIPGFSSPNNNRPLSQIAVYALNVLDGLNQGLSDQLGNVSYGRDGVDAHADTGGAQVLS